MGDNGGNCGNVNVKDANECWAASTIICVLIASSTSFIHMYQMVGFCVVLSMDLLFFVLMMTFRF